MLAEREQNSTGIPKEHLLHGNRPVISSSRTDVHYYRDILKLGAIGIFLRRQDFKVSATMSIGPRWNTGLGLGRELIN
ncbi:hypothetical protein SAMN03159288_04608 [Rhizobium sp. NFACC06-2]|nr:hypothetical protein SAMN03159288_04608 [Rhizobium sp. NFACC06-2]